MTIYIYDHDKHDKPWRGVFKKKKFKKWAIRILYTVKPSPYYNSEDVVFLHADSTGQKYWCDAVVKSEFPGHIVLVRSGGGKTYVENDKLQTGRIHTSELSPCQFEMIADQFFESVNNGSPKWDLLNPDALLNVLCSLSILCQGYLAVFAGPDGTVEVSDPDGKIADAHIAMGLSEALASLKSRKCSNHWLIADSDEGEQKRVKLRAIVTQKKFWSIISEASLDNHNACEKIIGEAKNEWDRGPKNELEFTPIENLIRKIFTPPLNDSSLVAEAYLLLAKRLEGGIEI